jgi:asparagine synthase (glutamine-hydrolysing)
MLKTSPYYGDAYGVASTEGVMISNEMPTTAPSSKLLAYKLVKVHPYDPPQPLSQCGYKAIIEGRLWEKYGPSDAQSLADIVGWNPSKGLRELIADNGSFAVTLLDEGLMLCCRDTVGVLPFYYGMDDSLFAVSSNRKALWSLGLVANTMPPGHLMEMNEKGVLIDMVQEVLQPPVVKISMAEAVKRLDTIMCSAVEARVDGLQRVSLGFSGGIDSSLLAYYLDRSGVQVDLICVGVKASKGFEVAERAAEILNLPLRTDAFTVDDVELNINEVMWSIEDPNPMKIGVGLPLFWTAKAASKAGIRAYFTGNGCDELFGGYYRHALEYAEQGDAVKLSILKDVKNSFQTNYERDTKICSDLGLELRLPFADIRVIQFGLSLPPELLLSPDSRAPRKLVLRALAKKLGLGELSMEPKKAVQYSTGVNNILRRLSKKDGLSLTEYLAMRFKRVKTEKLGDA